LESLGAQTGATEVIIEDDPVGVHATPKLSFAAYRGVVTNRFDVHSSGELLSPIRSRALQREQSYPDR
jgi:hypothetical protein